MYKGTNYLNLKKEVGFLSFKEEDFAKTIEGFENVYNELGANDQAALDSFLSALGIVVKEDALSVEARNVFQVRALSKKAIAAKDLLKLLDNRGLELTADEIDNVVDRAEELECYRSEIHPYTALNLVLDELYPEDEDEDEDEDDDWEEDCEDEKDEDKGGLKKTIHAFVISIEDRDVDE